MRKQLPITLLHVLYPFQLDSEQYPGPFVCEDLCNTNRTRSTLQLNGNASARQSSSVITTNARTASGTVEPVRLRKFTTSNTSRTVPNLLTITTTSSACAVRAIASVTRRRERKAGENTRELAHGVVGYEKTTKWFDRKIAQTLPPVELV